MSHQPLYIQACGCKMCIYRVGSTPRIKASAVKADRLHTMKWIHTHFTYEVFFVTSGMLQLVTEHYTKEYESAVVFLPPGLKHCSGVSGGESFCLLFSFEDGSDAAAAVKQRLEDGITALPLGESVAFYIRRFAEKTERNTREGEVAAGHLASLLFDELLPVLMQETEAHSGQLQRPSRHIGAIEEFINQNLHKKLTLADVAAAVYLSTKQISRILEKEYGCSFSRLVMDKRLARAEVLLKNTSLGISEIIAQIFPGTPNYFYAVFKRKYGMTPLKYRKDLCREDL